MAERELSTIIKAYDVRGLVDTELDEDFMRQVGAAFAQLVGTTVAIVRDMRPSSAPYAQAFAAGVISQGHDVIDVGMGSTDLVYYAAGHLDVAGAMITASHNPAQYNGIKLCRPGATPVGMDTGLGEIRRMIEDGIPAYDGPAGTITARPDLVHGYTAYLRELVDLTKIRPLTIAVDAANGMGGYMVPRVFGGLPVEIVPMYFELDGTFPNHEANPLDPANLVDLQAKVRETGADIGLAFDGDADRCFVVDETGQPVPPSAIVALIAARELAKSPGAAIVYNAITSRAVPEIVTEHGGVPARTRVGHTFMKSLMAETDAVFGGEHSGHYYFRDFWRADTGMLAALHVLAALGTTEQPLSALVAEYSRYVASGEINSEVDDVPTVLSHIEQHYDGAHTDRLDGLTVQLDDGAWFNLRPSNTEPLLRLNVEAPDTAAMTRIRDEVLALVRQ
ncbi:phosphomannomutase/phosphoglucomutase [Nocardia brasiliensis]|uniref:phosphomannomutase/phosphoglucomutase n=1 Tax=Nocardia brasiliensis TaxID=37326 RepID=UPI0004A77230|nr:phosphomannomutase/phosphoglucomutase [Nocardia brasiliensis]